MGQDYSRAWESFGSELEDLDKAAHVPQHNPIAVHRYEIIEAFHKEYLLPNVIQRFKKDPDLEGVNVSIFSTGSWFHDTKIWRPNAFDYILCMEYTDCIASVKDPLTHSHSIMIKPKPADGAVVGTANYVDFPIEKITKALREIVDNFWQISGLWSSNHCNIYPNSFKVTAISKKGMAVPIHLCWVDGHQHQHSVVIDLYPVYRDTTKKFKDLWTPPLHFEDKSSPCYQLKAQLQQTPLALSYDPNTKGWHFNYHYTDSLCFEYLKALIPTSIAALRMMKILRDTKLPWKCELDPDTKEVIGVKPWMSSFILLNTFMFEVLENCRPELWTPDEIPERLMSVLRRLGALTNYKSKHWGQASSFLLLPQAEKTGHRFHPIGKNIQALLDLMAARKESYESGHVTSGELCECCCHGVGHSVDNQPPHDVHDKKDTCVMTWNPRCLVDFKQPLKNKMCTSSLCGHKSSNGATIRMTQRGLLNLLKSSKSMVTEDHLCRYLPARKLRVMAATWNTGESRHIPHHLSELLMYPDAHDLYVVTLQESVMDRATWEYEVPRRLGPNFEMLFSGNHGALYTLILIRRDLFQFCNEPEDANVTVKPMFNWFTRTKGALGVHFKIFGTSLLFVNSHFTPQPGNLKKRIEDYQEICDTLELPTQICKREGVHLSERFDSVFWMGDLNFQMTGGKGAWSNPKVYNHCEKLLANHDELSKVIVKGQAFEHFHEGYVSFPPSYRFIKGSDMYERDNYAEHPSFTDRILFKTMGQTTVTCIHYNNVLNVRESDHKPIHGSYQLDIKI